MPICTIILSLLMMLCADLSAQPLERAPIEGVPQAEAEVTTYAGFGVAGFLPMRESFRVNYSTDLAGLPIEILGFVQFPLSDRSMPQLALRYTRRQADFFGSAEIRMVQLEPSFRYFLQPPLIGKTDDGEARTELGLYTGLGAQVSRTTVYGVIQETPTGADPKPRSVSKDHYNLGLGVDLGLTYPFSRASFVDAGIHVSTYLNDPVSLGGLGNLGGVSFNVAYRFGF